MPPGLGLQGSSVVSDLLYSRSQNDHIQATTHSLLHSSSVHWFLEQMIPVKKDHILKTRLERYVLEKEQVLALYLGQDSSWPQ